MSNDNCRFSSYDIGLALSSSSDSNCCVGWAADFFLPAPVLLLAFVLFVGGFPTETGLFPRNPETT